MMKTVKRYGVVLLVLTFWLILLALTCTILKYQFNLDEKSLALIQSLVGTLLFLATGLVVGKVYQRKGYLHGMVLALIYLLLLFLVTRFGIEFSFLNVVIKSSVLFVGSIIGVNLKRKLA